jgi:hypothetical protein
MFEKLTESTPKAILKDFQDYTEHKQADNSLLFSLRRSWCPSWTFANFFARPLVGGLEAWRKAGYSSPSETLIRVRRHQNVVGTFSARRFDGSSISNVEGE